MASHDSRPSPSSPLLKWTQAYASHLRSQKDSKDASEVLHSARSDGKFVTSQEHSLTPASQSRPPTKQCRSLLAVGGLFPPVYQTPNSHPPAEGCSNGEGNAQQLCATQQLCRTILSKRKPSSKNACQFSTKKARGNLVARAKGRAPWTKTPPLFACTETKQEERHRRHRPSNKSHYT